MLKLLLYLHSYLYTLPAMTYPTRKDFAAHMQQYVGDPACHAEHFKRAQGDTGKFSNRALEAVYEVWERVRGEAQPRQIKDSQLGTNYEL